jgi:predicted Zn-dependent peptidase
MHNHPRSSAVKSGIELARTSGGLPVIVEHLPYYRSASLAVYFGTGSRDEKLGQDGIAHMLEHMLFKGTKNRTAKEMSEQIEAAGGEQNGYTTKEVTSYQAFSLDETVDVAEDILADMVKEPLLEKSCLETEKNVVIQEIRMMENDPEDYIHVLFLQTLWPDNPMGRSEAGSVASVSSLTQDDISSFFSSDYRPPRMSVIATGNVQTDRILEWAEESFDDLAPSRSREERTPPRPAATIAVYPRDDEQAYVGMGFPGLSSVHQDRFAMRLATSILGMGTSSRLFQEIREKEGLVYEIFASSSSYTDCGAIGIFFSTGVGDQEKVARMVAQEIHRLKREGLEKEELDRAKRLLKGVYVRKLESSESRMVRLGEMFMSTGEAVSAEETLRRMDEVTEEDIASVCDDLMRREALTITLHAPRKESEKAAQNLEGLDF